MCLRQSEVRRATQRLSQQKVVQAIAHPEGDQALHRRVLRLSRLLEIVDELAASCILGNARASHQKRDPY